jgi:spermidine/putrescine transport system ATP-binding protein
VIRPEDLRSWDKTECSEEERAKMIPATVESVIYKGSTVDLVLRTESGRILSATEFFNEDDENLDFRRDEKVWVEWMMGWELVLNE